MHASAAASDAEAAVLLEPDAEGCEDVRTPPQHCGVRLGLVFLTLLFAGCAVWLYHPSWEAAQLSVNYAQLSRAVEKKYLALGSGQPPFSDPEDIPNIRNNHGGMTSGNVEFMKCVSVNSGGKPLDLGAAVPCACAVFDARSTSEIANKIDRIDHCTQTCGFDVVCGHDCMTGICPRYIAQVQKATQVIKGVMEDVLAEKLAATAATAPTYS